MAMFLKAESKFQMGNIASVRFQSISINKRSVKLDFTCQSVFLCSYIWIKTCLYHNCIRLKYTLFYYRFKDPSQIKYCEHLNKYSLKLKKIYISAYTFLYITTVMKIFDNIDWICDSYNKLWQ